VQISRSDEKEEPAGSYDQPYIAIRNLNATFGNAKVKQMKSINQSGKRSPRGQARSPKAGAKRPDRALERYEHYRSLAENARDIDRVTRENYWQHAEHFLRMLTEQGASLKPSMPV
jgi:hypothetical protein